MRLTIRQPFLTRKLLQRRQHSWSAPFRSSHLLELTQAQLNGGSLGESALNITSDDAHPVDDHHHNGDHPIEQSDKPRAGSKLLHTVFFRLSLTPLVAAEYIAKGYMLSDAILQRAIDMDSKLRRPFSLHIETYKFIEAHGISQKFLSYFHSMDKTIGERTLGPQQTVSAKLQATVEQATQQARSIDQQKGYLKIANDVRFSRSVLIFY